MWVGADPGGVANFGVAVLEGDGNYETFRVDCADEAVEFIRERPAGIGIDCPLWWSSARGSDRKADKWLRAKGIPSGTVQTANSLRGAALVQGVMLAVRVRERHGLVPISEAHPKALVRALGLYQRPWSELALRFGLKGREPRSEHERDALLAAVAARNGVTGIWRRDLAVERGAGELNPKRMWFGEVSYFWPD
jgi:predicted nuclease with RNAse H fold